jgi:hypothetical protein
MKIVSALLVVFAFNVSAQAPACEAVPKSVSLERRLRQLTLDLLGRPPTVAEYAFTKNKGAILEEDVLALMEREEFYAKMTEYHRALLRSNINSSVVGNFGDSRLTGDGASQATALKNTGNPSSSLRGINGLSCNMRVMQDNCNAASEDPLLEPTVKRCRDEKGVPLPVSVDYSPQQYTCTAKPTFADCAAAVGTGATQIPPKYAFYCDMRFVTNKLVPHFCSPRIDNTQTLALTPAGGGIEELDAQGRVIAFAHANPATRPLARLDRCTLNVETAIRGTYRIQPGCYQYDGVAQVPAPYWMPSNQTVFMCAIEAQARDINPWNMRSCNNGDNFLSERTCGCGARATRCDPGTSVLFDARVRAFNEEPLKIIDSVVRRNENYLSILTTRRSFLNGPLSQLYSQRLQPAVWKVTPPADLSAIPDLALDDENTWNEYTRNEFSSGILTTPAWLYRFPTQRARVSQFWSAFLCKHFTVPVGSVIPQPEDSCNRENNLAKRCGCTSCHATIEPVAAHWGRFGERNATFLNPESFPKQSTKCRDCALAGNVGCDGECSDYVMQALDGDGAQSLGLLRTYLYRTPAEEANILEGPHGLVQRIQQTGEFEQCATKNMWENFVGRQMSAEEEKLQMGTLSQGFVSDNYNLKKLILKIVMSDAYWRVD